MLLPGEVRENSQVWKVFIKYALWSFLFILLIFVFVWQNIVVADLEYKIIKTKSNLSALQKENQKLEIEVSFLSSPERIGSIAEKELKLIPVNGQDIVWINCNKNNDKAMFSRK